MVEVKRKYVFPGQVIVEGKYKVLANAIRMGERILSTRVGMAEIVDDSVRVIPLTGPYIPRADDTVIGKIVNFSAFGWDVDINSIFYAYLPAQSVFGRDFSPVRESLTKTFEIGDVIVANILAFDRTRDPLLTVQGPGLGLIQRGEIVKISSTKVPRVIGKKGSMINTLESGTGCNLIVGQNGLIAVSGPPEGVFLAVKALRLIETEAHTADLTSKVEKLLLEAKEAGKK